MLSTNEQTELEILLSIEEPDQAQQIRMDYLLRKKDSEVQMKSFEPVDIDSMQCKCLNCFLRTIPEHAEETLLLTELNRYFEHRIQKGSSFKNPVITSMHETVLKEANTSQVLDKKPVSEIVTVDKVINKYLENKLSKTEKEEILANPVFIETVYEVCLFILQKGIEVAKQYKLRSLIAVQSYYMTVDFMFSVLDKLDYEPSWDLVELIHGNMVKETSVVSELADLVPNVHLHSNCTPNTNELLNTLLEVLRENSN